MLGKAYARHGFYLRKSSFSHLNYSDMTFLKKIFRKSCVRIGINKNNILQRYMYIALINKVKRRKLWLNWIIKKCQGKLLDKISCYISRISLLCKSDLGGLLAKGSGPIIIVYDGLECRNIKPRRSTLLSCSRFPRLFCRNSRRKRADQICDRIQYIYVQCCARASQQRVCSRAGKTRSSSKG